MICLKQIVCINKFLNKKSLSFKNNSYLIDLIRNFTNETHFGFETVTEKEKEEKVYEVFHNVADKYDLMNDVMSGGIHRLWKDHFVRRIGSADNINMLDVAGGTGDISFRFLNQLKLFQPLSHINKLESNYRVTILDINRAMLDVGASKAQKLKLYKDISFVQGNAESLPFQNDQFDLYTVAYGIRNMTHIEKVLNEAYRVLKPGGRFMCLEFSQLNNLVLQKIYDEYSFQIIPAMGHLIASDWKSYRYLVESIRNFPDQVEFKEMIEEAGFSEVTYENLLFGISCIHSGFKL